MQTLFMSFRAPSVPYVDIFRDHLDPQQFYILTDRPQIAVDAKTGMPLFSYTLFSRNIEIAYASAAENQPVESQLGALNMTVDLSVPDDDMAAIRTYLVSVLEEERIHPSPYNKLFGVPTTGTVPKIGYMDGWLQGSVRLDMLEGLGNTFKRNSSQETHPTLRGTNSASLWATFGAEGAQLLWGSLKEEQRQAEGTPPSPETRSLQANVVYELEGIARVPGLRVTVTANGSAVYKELRERIQVMERVGDTRWSYPQISKLTKELRENRVIDVVWDDMGIPAGDPAADEIKQQLEQTVMGVIANQIVALFFKPFELQGLKDEDLGMTFTHSLGGKPGSRLWLNEYKEEFIQDISFTLEKTQNVRFKVYPQTSLLANLTDEQIDQLVKVVDVGSPEIRVMTLHVYTNADFQADRIANITATLSYRQFDTLVNDWVEASESFVFRTGQETFAFRTRLARDRDGRLIDKYDAKATVHYIATSQAPTPIELKGISERDLTFSYDRLGYVRVEVQAGDIDFTQIKEVYVDFLYDAAQSEPDAKGTIKLTEKDLKAQWTTSKHGRQSNRYRYTVRYVFQNGAETSEPARMDDRGTLVIHDTLVGRLRRTFDVTLDAATVENLALKVRYEDPPNAPEEARHLFPSTGSWEYVRSLRQNGPQELKYAYEVQYKDGQSESIPWRALAPGDDLGSIRARRYRFTIMVAGEGLDWTKWRAAYIELKYRDSGHEYVLIEELRLNQESPFKTVEILGFSPEARAYDYRVMFVPKDDGEVVEVPPDGGTLTKAGVLLLETLV